MREVYGRAILKVDLEPLGPPMFDLKMSALPGLGIASGFCSEFRVHHASQMIENDDLILLVALSGSSVMRHRDREELVGPAAR